MNDTLISFETAKLAASKNFNLADRDDPTREPYEVLCYDFDQKVVRAIQTYNYYLAPTQSLLQRWLRDYYGIDIMIEPFINGSETAYAGWYFLTDNSLPSEDLTANDYKATYEEALENTLVDVLNLIP